LAKETGSLMAWQEVDTDVGPKVGRVKYSVALKHGGARISVPKHIVEQLGWKKTATFRLLVGGGDMEGKLRIEPPTRDASPPGGAPVRPRRQTRRSSVSAAGRSSHRAM
jgi:hypothetical protein